MKKEELDRLIEEMANIERTNEILEHIILENKIRLAEIDKILAQNIEEDSDG